MQLLVYFKLHPSDLRSRPPSNYFLGTRLTFEVLDAIICPSNVKTQPKKVSQMSTSTQYPFTNSARHPLPNSVFFMLKSKVSAPNQKLFPMPANQDLALHASLCVDQVIQTVVSHYAKVKPSQLKTHPLPVIPQIAITAKNASISEYVTQYNQITAACLIFLNAKIASYLATR